MKIVINSKENKKLLQNFPEDPYSDITIITQYSKLHLVLAYLSIDSQYFANLDPDIKQIDLSHLVQQSLIKVLKSLYGAQLIAYSVQQLFNLYTIIQQLQIQQYKILLKESLQQILLTQKDSPILNSIQMLDFCIKNQILVQEMKTFHFDTKLKILQSSKNYLQLNKLSESTLSSLLLDFYYKKVQKGDQIINHIMENYFNRKNIRPGVFFANQQYEELKKIWENYHHKIVVVNTELSTASEQKKSARLSNTISNLSRVDSMSIQAQQPQMRRSQTALNNFLNPSLLSTAKSTLFKSQNAAQNQILDSKISNLQQQLKAKDEHIRQLRLQLASLKQTKQFLNVDSDHEDTQTSLLQNLKKHKKNKQTAIIDLDNIRQVQSFDTSKNVYNQAKMFGNKNAPTKKMFQQFQNK